VLKKSGYTVQTPGIRAPLTQSKHTLCLQHTKPQIYPVFLRPVNNKAPRDCTHCGSLKLTLITSLKSRERSKN